MRVPAIVVVLLLTVTATPALGAQRQVRVGDHLRVRVAAPKATDSAWAREGTETLRPGAVRAGVLHVGHLIGQRGDSLFVRSDDATLAFSRHDVLSLAVRQAHRKTLAGMALGALAGAALGILIDSQREHSGIGDVDVLAFALAPVGALVGGGIGSAVGFDIWEPATLGPAGSR